MQVSSRFGGFGGRFVCESLWSPLLEVEERWLQVQRQESFWGDFDALLDWRAGRPTALTPMHRLQQEQGGALIWLKREDLSPGGNYCILSASLQALFAKAIGKRRVISETATGAFGVALGSIGAALGLEVVIHMTRDDGLREKRRVALMRELGVKVELTESPTPGMAGRFVAQAWAMRDWVSALEDTHYCASSLASPDPYPRQIARACAMIGAELIAQLRRLHIQPSYVICPVGSGALAAGVYSPLLELDDQSIQLVGVQGCGDDPQDRRTALCGGQPGFLHGVRSYMLQSEDGLVQMASTRAHGLAEPIVGPQHAQWLELGAVHYVQVADVEAAKVLRYVARHEGLTLAPETGAALSYAMKVAKTLPEDEHMILTVSGSGSAELEWLKERLGGSRE